VLLLVVLNSGGNMLRCRHLSLSAAVIAFLVVASQAQADDPCAASSKFPFSGLASSPDGVWTANSQYGGVYKIKVQSSANPPFEIVDGKPAAQDSVAVDNAPSPNEIALGALTGQPVAAWAEFANDQDHPRTDSKFCPPFLVARTAYSVAPPAGAVGMYIRQMTTAFNFAEDPPVMTETYDFWPLSRPSKVVRFSLTPESGLATMGRPGGAGAATCSSPGDCLQTPGFGAVVALAGSFLGLLGGVFGAQLADITRAVGQALSDTFKPVTDAQNALAEVVKQEPIEVAHDALEVAAHIADEAGAGEEVVSVLEVTDLTLGPLAIASPDSEPTPAYYPRTDAIDPMLFTDVPPFPGGATVQAPVDSAPFQAAPANPEIIDPSPDNGAGSAIEISDDGG